MVSLGELVAGIAHEINNPINYIGNGIKEVVSALNNLTEIINKIKPPGERGEKFLALFEPVMDIRKNLLTYMSDGASRIQKIILSLRNFSRHDEAPIKDVHIDEGIDSTLALINKKLTKIKIIKDYQEIPAISCKPAEINQAIMNICSNAADALNEHKTKNPHLIIRTFVDNEMICIEFENNGPPIPEKIRKRIFDPFFTTKDVGKGTGLGLSISYQIIEKHNGSLSFETGDWGTKFKLKLPV